MDDPADVSIQNRSGLVPGGRRLSTRRKVVGSNPTRAPKPQVRGDLTHRRRRSRNRRSFLWVGSRPGARPASLRRSLSESRIQAQAGAALRPFQKLRTRTTGQPPGLEWERCQLRARSAFMRLSGSPALPLDQTLRGATVLPIGRRPSRRGCVFIQVIQGHATNPDALRAELDRWKAELQPGADAGRAACRTLSRSPNGSRATGARGTARHRGVEPTGPTPAAAGDPPADANNRGLR
jgi:hypothetical protein